MPQKSSREIKKRLFEFARQEYKTKEPNYVEVRKAKGIKTLYRGPVPQLILTKYKPIAYVVFADYGSIARLYHFNRDGYCIKDTSYSVEDMGKIKKHLEKTTTKILRYPKIEVKRTLTEKAVQIDEQFAKIVNAIEKITNTKLTSRPVITLEAEKQIAHENILALLNTKGDFWLLPEAVVTEERITTTLLTLKAFELFFQAIFSVDSLALEFSFLGALLFLKNRSLQETVLQLSKKSSHFLSCFISEPTSKKHEELRLLFNYCTAIARYLLPKDFPPTFRSSKAIHQLLVDSFYQSLYDGKDSFHRLASAVLKQSQVLASQNDCMLVPLLLLVYTFLLIQSRGENAFPDPSAAAVSVQACQDDDRDERLVFAQSFLNAAADLKVKMLNNYAQDLIELFPSSLGELLPLFFERLLERSLIIYSNYTVHSLEQAGDLSFIIINRSDMPLNNFRLQPLSWKPKDALESIGAKRQLRQASVQPGEELHFLQPVVAKRKGSIKIANLQITFRDVKGRKISLQKSVPKLKIT